MSCNTLVTTMPKCLEHWLGQMAFDKIGKIYRVRKKKVFPGRLLAQE